MLNDRNNPIQTTTTNSTRIRAELDKLNGFLLARAKCLNSTVKITKRKKRLNISTKPRRRTSNAVVNHPPRMLLGQGLPDYFLFEFASGYALFYAHGVDHLHMSSVDIYEKFIKNSDNIFTLKAFHPFSSIADALVQMNAISNSKVTPQLKSFLVDNLPKRLHGQGSSCFVATSNSELANNITTTTGFGSRSGEFSYNLMRGLRINIDKFIDGLEPKDLGKQQLNLARLYSRQRCTTMVVNCSKAISSSSLKQPVCVPHRGKQRSTSMVVKSSKAVAPSSLQQFVVVPHRFEGVFIAKGKENFICTRSLVPGETLNGEELLYIQNEDGTKAEYRVWNPLRSKLAAAILCGVKNICAKPGSHVLVIGDICEITISHLSDLVGPDGLVYVVGFSGAVVHMVEKRPNVISIFGEPDFYWKYRMVVGMVDVIFAEMVYPQQVRWIVKNARFYLKAGGHYMISTRENNIDLTSQGKNIFASSIFRSEFSPIELVMLDPVVREYVMSIGGFRVLEE